MQELAGLAAAIDWDEAGTEPPDGDREQVLAAIHTVRQHPATYFGFSEGYLDRLREAASPEQARLAGECVDRALAGDLYFPPHNNALAALGAETLALGVDAARAERIAAKVLERQEDWARNVWTFGITHGVANLMRCLCPLPAVADEHLVPLAGWLCGIAPTEWASARSWCERVLGPSGHNWFIHSLFGLWMGGRLFGVFKPLQTYRALAPTYLEREVALLFADDGWSKEGANGYHCFAFGNVLEFKRLAERHGVVFSPEFEARVRRIADATWRMQGPDGDGPIFGDDSPGAKGAAAKPTVFPERGYGLRTRRLAAEFGLGEAKGAAEALTPGEDASFLPHCGDDLAEAYRVLPAVEPPLDTDLRASGLYAMRSNWRPDGDWLAVNAMQIGPVVSSHKHADLLNIELCVKGRRVLVDNWYGDATADDGSYQSTPEIRNNPMKRRWRVGSSAHNVPTVDGEDIVPVQQIYRYGWSEVPFVDEWVSDPRYVWFSAVHEAYRRLPVPVPAVRRKIFYLRGQYWVVIDRFTGNYQGSHTYTQHWHIPGCERVVNGIRSVGAGGNVMLVPVAGVTGDLAVEPCPHPITNYQNPDHVTITTEGNDVVMAAVLMPFEDDAIPRISAGAVPVSADWGELTPWEMTGIRIELPDRVDTLVIQHLHMNHPWQCGDVHGDGRLWHSELTQ